MYNPPDRLQPIRDAVGSGEEPSSAVRQAEVLLALDVATLNTDFVSEMIGIMNDEPQPNI